MSDAQWKIKGCQFGSHGEPFLWNGSGDDDVDIAIMRLINLATDNPKLAHEASEFIEACVHDAASAPARRREDEENETLSPKMQVLRC
jgi:hypothetical protein